MNKCEYCDKILSSSSNLKIHQTTAKYCLEKRKKNSVKEYKCCCTKIFNTKTNFERHKQNCKVYNNIILPYDEEISKLKNDNIKLQNENNIYLKQIDKLQEQITSIAKAGITKSTITNNIINSNNKTINISPLDLSNERIKNILETKYTKDYIFDGQKGLAHFTYEHILKDSENNLSYVCTDPNRQNFKYKNIKGELKKDIKAKELTKRLIKGGLKETNTKIASAWWTSNTGEIDENKFTNLLPKITEINTLTVSNNTLFANELSAIATSFNKNILEESKEKEFLSDSDFSIELE
jgi:hypothetical protein